jgi:hypothetical protein
MNSKTDVKPQNDFNNYDSLIKDDESSHTGGVILYKVMVQNKYTVIPVSQHTHTMRIEDIIWQKCHYLSIVVLLKLSDNGSLRFMFNR